MLLLNEHSGKVHLDDYPFPRELQQLFQSDTECAKNFRSTFGVKTLQ